MAEAKDKDVKDSVASESTPHLEVIDRVKNIPVVHSAIEKTESTYSYLKGSNDLINWVFTSAETGLNYATATAAPYTAPLAKKFEEQISAVDHKLCEGLNIVEQKVPMMKKPPEQIYEAAKAVMSSSLHPTMEKLQAAKESATQQAATLKNISMVKANELLNTQYGSMAVQGVDNTSVLINGLLDRYFPPAAGEEDPPAPVSADENKVLHAVQTIGQLSTKTANRVFHSVAAQLKTIKKEDVSAYITNVISILHLTHYLSLNDKPVDNKEAQSVVGEKKG
ncbi:lipid storage droplets surface-binding protein 2-like [Colletes latitarsis]|uniref:lipid storage droplets surface-binding protein 2-like n=1 Tax=Colletes latitarsis TaxID=2605962 RepID=UPI00403658B2